MKLKSPNKEMEINNQADRHPTERKKIFASYTSNRGLMSKSCQECKKPNTYKIKSAGQQWHTPLIPALGWQRQANP